MFFCGNRLGSKIAVSHQQVGGITIALFFFFLKCLPQMNFSMINSLTSFFFFLLFLMFSFSGWGARNSTERFGRKYRLRQPCTRDQFAQVSKNRSLLPTVWLRIHHIFENFCCPSGMPTTSVWRRWCRFWPEWSWSFLFSRRALSSHLHNTLLCSCQ